MNEEKKNLQAAQATPHAVHDAANRREKLRLIALHMQSGKMEDAEHILQQLAEENPEDPMPLLNLAQIAMHQRDLQQAEKYICRAEALDAHYPDLALLHAQIDSRMGKNADALSYALVDLEHNPHRRESWILLHKLLTECAVDEARLEKILHGELAEKSANLLAWVVTVCRENFLWKYLPALEKELAKLLDHPQTERFDAYVFFSLLMSHVPQSAHRHACEVYWQHCSMVQPLPNRKRASCAATAPLHVGIICSRYSKHARGFLVAGLLEKLPKGRIVWHAYSNSRDDHSTIRRRIFSGFDHFTNIVNLDDREVAELVRRNHIDILLDLDGMTENSRPEILAYRPAPVQLFWLAQPGTVGSGRFVDFILGDEWGTPLYLADGFSEKILQLPRCYQPNDDVEPDFSPAGTRADHNLPEDVAVFCCFNQPMKFSPETFALWQKIFQAVPDAVLWIPDTGHHGQMQRLQKQLQAAGIHHAVFAPSMPQIQHIARLSLADLVLDTLPYNAHTTCSDALRTGTPVLTLPGETFAGRVAASILTTAGLPEWIAKSPEDYVQKAVAFAKLSAAARKAVKAQVFRTYWSSPMPDNKKFAALLEKIFIALYERYRSGLPPEHLRATEEGTLVNLE